MRASDTIPRPAWSLLDRMLGERWRKAHCEPIEGATNTVIRLKFGSEERYAVRVPQLDDSKLRVDRHSECIALTAVQQLNITPDIIACDPDTGVLVTRWLDSFVWTPAQARSPTRAAVIGALLRRLHSLPIPEGV